MSKNELLKQVKANGQDHEWYPTTEEIIRAMFNNIIEHKDASYTHISLLDIGAGNGKLFKTIEKLNDEQEKEENRVNLDKKYAIEKSTTLINSLDKDIFVIGTDFYATTLIDKKVDLIFCNPPYSCMDFFSEKIIREANAPVVYLVIPERWEHSKSIVAAIKVRDATVETVGSFSFEDSEDRKARAKVSLLRISLYEESSYRNRHIKTDPFEIWFNETYDFDETKSKSTDFQEAKDKRERLNDLVKGNDLIVRLEELYNKELMSLHENYKSLASIDASLLEELGVSKKGIREGLEVKIKGLKNLYWSELFNNLDKITSRLTKKTREKLLGTLMENTSVDFTAQNAYAVVIFTIKQANEYFDEQLLAVYKMLSDRDNVRLYKSNHRIIEDGWRYNKNDMSHYVLDYRIVHHHYNALADNRWDSRDENGLSNSAADIINDISIIANNLGFYVHSKTNHFEWGSGKKNVFTFTNGDTFCDIKCFKNGNIHFRFSQEFMKALNLEAARLNMWIKSPFAAAEEFDITLEEATEMFGTNFTLLPSNLTNLLPNIQQEEETIEEANNSFANGTLF